MLCQRGEFCALKPAVKEFDQPPKKLIKQIECVNVPRCNQYTPSYSLANAKDDKCQYFIQLDLISCYYRKKNEVQTTKFKQL